MTSLQKPTRSLIVIAEGLARSTPILMINTRLKLVYNIILFK